MRSFFLHHPRETDLALFAGGELGPLARWRIERHLDKCACCQADVSDFFHLQGDLSDLAELPAVDWQALAHRIKVAVSQAEPETEAVSVAGWFGRPSAWRLGVVSATALCAFVVYKQLPLVKTVPESAVFSDKIALEGALQFEGDQQLGQTEAPAEGPAEEGARMTFADHRPRAEESARKADAAKDLDDAEPASQLLSESARQKAKQVTAVAVGRVAADAFRSPRRADGPAPSAPSTIKRMVGGTAEGSSSLVADESEETARSNTELAGAELVSAELASNEKLRRVGSDTKSAPASVEASFKKESSRSLQDGRTGAYRESRAISAQQQNVQSRDSESPRSPPAPAPTSVLDEVREADLSASATRGRLRVALEERSELGVDENAPADPGDQLKRAAGARKPVTLALNKGPAESRREQEAGAGERAPKMKKGDFVFASGGGASNAETFEGGQFSVLSAAWNDANTEVGVAADGGMMIRVLDSATGTITITNVYLP